MLSSYNFLGLFLFMPLLCQMNNYLWNHIENTYFFFLSSQLPLACQSIKWAQLSKKSRIRETPNLSTDADSNTNIFVSAGIKKGANKIFTRLNRPIGLKWWKFKVLTYSKSFEVVLKYFLGGCEVI